MLYELHVGKVKGLFISGMAEERLPLAARLPVVGRLFRRDVVVLKAALGSYVLGGGYRIGSRTPGGLAWVRKHRLDRTQFAVAHQRKDRIYFALDRWNEEIPLLIVEHTTFADVRRRRIPIV